MGKPSGVETPLHALYYQFINPSIIVRLHDLGPSGVLLKKIVIGTYLPYLMQPHQLDHYMAEEKNICVSCNSTDQCQKPSTPKIFSDFSAKLELISKISIYTDYSFCHYQTL